MFTAAVFLCGVVAHDAVTFPATAPQLPLPPTVASVLRTLNDLRSAEAARLFDRPRVRPFLLDAVLGTDPPTGKDFREAYALHLADLNAGRVARWKKAGRIDLFAEAGVVGTRSRSATADPFVIELHDLVREVVGERLPATLAKKLAGGEKEAKGVMEGLAGHQRLGFLNDFPKFGSVKDEDPPASAGTLKYGGVALGTPPQWKGGELRLNVSSMPGACLADRVLFTGHALHYGKAYVVAEEFVGFSRIQPNRHFEHTFLVINAPANLSAADGEHGIRVFSASAVVADGDVELSNDQHLAAVVIARGDVRMHGPLTHGLSLFVSGGTISAAKEGSELSCVLLAKTGITVGDDKTATVVRPVGTQLTGVGPAELGLRWFELADVGLELGTDGKRPVVKVVSEASPFRGLMEPRDVLRSVNDVSVRTVEEARRALRRAVVLGCAVVEFDRGRETFWRVVRIDDVLK